MEYQSVHCNLATNSESIPKYGANLYRWESALPSLHGLSQQLPENTDRTQRTKKDRPRQFWTKTDKTGHYQTFRTETGQSTRHKRRVEHVLNSSGYPLELHSASNGYFQRDTTSHPDSCLLQTKILNIYRMFLYLLSMTVSCLWASARSRNKEELALHNEAPWRDSTC